MTYYVQCPKCGDLVETTNYIPEDMVCYSCGHHYKVTDKNSMKRPPYDIFPCISFFVMGLSVWYVGRVLNLGAPTTELLYALWYALSAVAITVATDCVRNRIERSIRKVGMDRVRKSLQRKGPNNCESWDKHR